MDKHIGKRDFNSRVTTLLKMNINFRMCIINYYSKKIIYVNISYLKTNKIYYSMISLFYGTLIWFFCQCTVLKLNANENLDAIANMQVTLVFPLAVYLVSSVIAINRITSIYAFFSYFAVGGWWGWGDQLYRRGNKP